MKRRKTHLVHVHQRIFLNTVFTRHESAPRPPVPLLVALGHSPTVLETEKITVFCEARLHTHKESHDHEVPAEIPLVLIVLDSFQKELNIVIRLLQMD